MKRLKPCLIFFALTSLGLSQSTYFLYFSWDNQGIELEEIDSIQIPVKHRPPKNISNQLLYIELSTGNQPVYWTAIPDPRKVHVENPNADGSLHRKDVVFTDVDFAIRVPAYFNADKIRFLKPSPGQRTKLQLDTPLSTQRSLHTIQELPIRLIKIP